MKSSSGQNINLASQLLKDGKLVAIPTETVYGLAANGLDINAITSIFEAKNRPFFDPLILHTNSIEKINQWILDFPPALKKLAENFWPGPLTLLLPKNDLIPDLVTSGSEKVAFRIPNHELTLSLLSTLNSPLAAPSANPFGYISPTTAQHVADQLAEKVSYILDGDACEIGVESTIVGLEDNQLIVYRLGGLSVEEIQTTLPDIEIKVNTHSSSNPQAPGMLKSHYAPKIPFFIASYPEEIYQKNEIALLVFGVKSNNFPIENQFYLSKNQDTKEAAKKLFQLLRSLDNSNFKAIYLPALLPNIGLGPAINDRLKRAAAKE